MVKRNVWHIIHCGLRFGEMGCECFQFMLSIVFKIRYQAFFWHKYERMHQKLCIQTKLFMTLKISHHILQTEIIQKCCLRAQVFFFFFLLQKCIKFIFYNFIKCEHSTKSASAFQWDHVFSKAVGRWKGICILLSGQWQDMGFARVSQSSLTIKKSVLRFL